MKAEGVMETQAVALGKVEKRRAVMRFGSSWRREGGTAMVEKLGKLLRDLPRKKDQYGAGEKLGKVVGAGDLSDVLYALQQKGLGRVTVVQESNSHLVLKVENCANCQVAESNNGCHFTAGYLAGALKACGKPETTVVSEVSCGGYPGDTCVFMASW